VPVDVENFGRVIGKQEEAVGKIVDCFLGIPFAKPPIGNLRFRAPEPLDAPSDDTPREFDATQRPASCYQTVDTAFESKYVDLWNPNTNMSENCLYLNVWKPQGGAAKKAVLVRFLSFFRNYVVTTVRTLQELILHD